MRILSVLKKVFRWLGIFILALLIIANLFILISGKFYLYKAVWYTYFHGQTGPGIYDQDYFYSREIPETVKPDYWHDHESKDKVKPNQEILSKIESYQSTSILVIHKDKILYEKYWQDHDEDKVSNSFSVAKSITSMLIGIAIDEGKIKSVDQPVSDFIPEYKNDDRKKLKIKHLLTMSAALDWTESGGNPLSDNAEAYYGWDLKGMIDDVKMAGEPGKTFIYQSGATLILGYIIEVATGKKLANYAYEKIWEPIGAEHRAYWSLDQENGLEKAYCCFYSTTRDFARIGRIMMDGGVWKSINFGESHDVRILSEKYVAESITPAILKNEDGENNDCYGYKWWLTEFDGKKVFYARGILGQYILCIPEMELIIVRTGHKRGDKKEGDDHPSDIYVYMDLAKDLLKQL
jgi:CubicO group peptidase (beta-lactamase class C family)